MNIIQEVSQILTSYSLHYCGLGSLENKSFTIAFLGEGRHTHLIHFDSAERTMYIGDSLVGHSAPWVDWWNYTPSELGVHGISRSWWLKHKYALQEICALIETETQTTGPQNCRPDICL